MAVYVPEKFQSIFWTCFNGTIRRPWVWKLHWHCFDIERDIFWKNHFYIFNGLLSPTIHFWIFKKNNRRVQCNGHRDGKNSEAVSNNNCSSDSKAQLYLNFQKEYISVIEKYSTVVVRTWGRLPLLPVFGTIFGRFCVFQGDFRPAFRSDIYNIW